MPTPPTDSLTSVQLTPPKPLDPTQLWALLQQRRAGGLPGLPRPTPRPAPRLPQPAAPAPAGGGDLTSALRANMVYAPTLAKAGPGMVPMTALGGLVEPDAGRGVPVGVNWAGLTLEQQEALMQVLQERAAREAAGGVR